MKFLISQIILNFLQSISVQSQISQNAHYQRIESLNYFNSTIEIKAIIQKNLIECLKVCTDLIECNLIEFGEECKLYVSISQGDFLSDKEYYYKKINIIPGCQNIDQILNQKSNIIQNSRSNTGLEFKDICYIEPDTFIGFSNLKRLDIYQSSISVLKSNSLHYLDSLNELYISAEFEIIEANSFVHFSNLEYFGIYGTRLKEIYPNMLNGLNNLIYLDMASNLFEKLKAGVFDHLTNLDYLGLKNNKIATIEPYTFQNLTMVTQIFLNENELTELEDYIFVGLENLGILVLNNNQIKNISLYAFYGAVNLNELDLYYNKIICLHDNVFKWLENLENLYLSYNSIELVYPKAFNGLKNLKKLDLSVNNIKQIDSFTLSELIYLENIYLSVNKLNSLPENLFEDQLNILELHLNRNLLQNFSVTYIRAKEINLFDNPLKTINYSLVQSNQSFVEVLNLKACELVYIGTDAFKNLLQLKEINLMNNFFQFIDSNIFNGLENLKKVYSEVIIV